MPLKKKINYFYIASKNSTNTTIIKVRSTNLYNYSTKYFTKFYNLHETTFAIIIHCKCNKQTNELNKVFRKLLTKEQEEINNNILLLLLK